MAAKNYQRISSPENGRIKALKKLGSKKYRREAGQFLAENLAIITDALKDGHDFGSLFVTDEFAAKHREQLEYIENNSRSRNYYLLDPRLNKLYSSLDTPSGIAAVYDVQDRPLDSSSVVYLDGISDPGNLGTIMRSALAFDFVNLVLDAYCVDVYNPKVVGAAKDAIFKLNILEDKTGGWLKENKLPVYIASAHAGSSLSGFEPARAFCLVLGSERRGVSPETVKQAKKSLKIAISVKIESLNVASAAAILFYELRRKKK